MCAAVHSPYGLPVMRRNTLNKMPSLRYLPSRLPGHRSLSPLPQTTLSLDPLRMAPRQHHRHPSIDQPILKSNLVFFTAPTMFELMVGCLTTTFKLNTRHMMPTLGLHRRLRNIPQSYPDHGCPPSTIPGQSNPPQTYSKLVMTSASHWLLCEANIKMIRIMVKERVPFQTCPHFLFHFLVQDMCLHRISNGVFLRMSLRPHISVPTLECSLMILDRNIFHLRNLPYPNVSCKITVFVPKTFLENLRDDDTVKYTIEIPWNLESLTGSDGKFDCARIWTRLYTMAQSE